MKTSTPIAGGSNHRVLIRIAGAAMLGVGLVVTAALLLISSSSLLVFIIAGALVVIGTIFACSPETIAVVLESISWLP
jgi:hypothetical protein